MTAHADCMPSVDVVPESGNAESGIRKPNFDEVLDAVCRGHGVSARDVRGRRRFRHVVAARHDLWLRLRALGWSYPAIGEICGVDHTTVMAGVRKAALFLSSTTEPMAGAEAPLARRDASGEQPT